MKKLLCYCSIFMFNLSLINTAWALDIVILNKPSSNNDARYNYTHDLLTLVMEQTAEQYGAADIHNAPIAMTRNRTLAELKSGKLINVMPQVSSKEWDQQLLAVNIPIRKGIQGFRVFIIRSSDSNLLPSISNLQQLKSIPTGAMHSWSAYQIMKYNGFKMVNGANYDGLFHMLIKQRFDTFSRGINEVYQEIDSREQQYPQLMIDESTLVYMPLPTVFYVSPNAPKLAERIEKGLMSIMENGIFDDFFYQHFCPILIKSKLSQRQLFELENPMLNADFLQQAKANHWLLDPSQPIKQRCQNYVQPTLPNRLHNH
ncbi:hypothetical protein ACFOD0_09910 [Shewanella intestini]|uniref:Transporter substrate-binding domain-containing protein n=1 Tax=Shewanella intestini TaxID=2017544 RepID=A0ABS5I617_9GAMM|nr:MULTISPECIES: hypothetical protein [Shewanella]MBR9728780.1 hypothetical protein [Shewanella intestini]MRG36855.1 hypothetical protein [Shewanella sp. XMDDZSB0408]